MKKEYIRDEGRVRLCTSNIAKMNILESMYYHRFQLYHNVIEAIKEFIGHWYLLVNIFIIFTLPIAYPIMTWREIRKAKKEMERYAKKNRRLK